MTHASENKKAAGSAVSTSRKWIRPTVQYLAAGSAADGSGPAIDGILNPS